MDNALTPNFYVITIFLLICIQEILENEEKMSNDEKKNCINTYRYRCKSRLRLVCKNRIVCVCVCVCVCIIWRLSGVMFALFKPKNSYVKDVVDFFLFKNNLIRFLNRFSSPSGRNRNKFFINFAHFSRTFFSENKACGAYCRCFPKLFVHTFDDLRIT